MTMKKLCFLLLFTASAALFAAAKPAESRPAATAATAAQPAAATAAKPAESKSAESKPVSVLTSIYRTYPDPSAFAEPEKAESLIKRHAALVQKIQDERKRLLQEDTKAKALREEITRLNRELASLLETKKTMIELNSQLTDLDIAISRLKPAPPPPPPTEDTEKTDDKAEKAEKAATEQTDKAASTAKSDDKAASTTKQADNTRQTGKEK